jgi:hypothetical protein
MDRIIAALLLVGWATGGLVGEREPVTPAAPKEPLKRYTTPTAPNVPPKRYTICPIAGPCWEVVGTPIR